MSGRRAPTYVIAPSESVVLFEGVESVRCQSVIYFLARLLFVVFFPVSWPGHPFAKTVFFALSTTTSVQVKCFVLPTGFCCPGKALRQSRSFCLVLLCPCFRSNIQIYAVKLRSCAYFSSFDQPGKVEVNPFAKACAV